MEKKQKKHIKNIKQKNKTEIYRNTITKFIGFIRKIVRRTLVKPIVNYRKNKGDYMKSVGNAMETHRIIIRNPIENTRMTLSV